MAMKNPMFHVSSFYGSVGIGTANYTQLPAVQDGQLTRTQGNNLLAGNPSKLDLGFSSGVNLDRVRIVVPSLRDLGRPHLSPVNNAAGIPTVPNIYDPGERPLTIQAGEEFGLEAITTDAGAQNCNAIVFLTFGEQPAMVGPTFRLRGTATITGVTGGWASGQVIMDDTLTGGIFEIVGMDVISANVNAARLIFPQGGYRPGCIARDGAGDTRVPQFSMGKFGSFGQFQNFALPQLEIFAVGASASQVVYFDLVKVSSFSSLS